jgi:ECF sigma factor
VSEMESEENELKRDASGYLRGERPEHTLQTTALVHQTYLRMVHLHSPKMENRKHFLVLAAPLQRDVQDPAAETADRWRTTRPAERSSYSGQGV